MNRTRRFLSVVFVLVILFSFGILALSTSAYKNEACMDCGWLLGEVCYVMNSVFSHNNTHSYSGGTCTTSMYTGRISMWCEGCNAVKYYYDGYPCYEIHHGCASAPTIWCRWR